MERRHQRPKRFLTPFSSRRRESTWFGSLLRLAKLPKVEEPESEQVPINRSALDAERPAGDGRALASVRAPPGRLVGDPDQA